MLDQIISALPPEFILQARAYSVLIGFNYKAEDIMDGQQLHLALEERMKSPMSIPVSLVTDCINWLLEQELIIRLPNGFKRTPDGTLISEAHYKLIHGEE